MDSTRLQDVLLERYAHLKLKNPQCSKRAFARRLGVSHSALIEIMAGKRNASEKMAGKLCDRMLLSPEEKFSVLKSFTQAPRAEFQYDSISSDQFHLISEWHYFALLNLIKLPGIKTDTVTLSARLGLNPSEVERAIARLERLGLIKNLRGRWIRTQARIQTLDGIRDQAIQRSHASFLELAGDKLRDVEVESRDFTTMTMTANPKHLPQAKALIREFQDRLAALLEDGKATEVFVFGTQLFPVTTQVTPPVKETR